jgi:pimeloyl-ACP methyl ester carboxylesterase
MKSLNRPLLEGSVAVREGRRLSFAEYGSWDGAAVIWLHGTPGGRRQIPLEARAYAVTNGLRIIGVDRPGIGSSTPHLYDDIADSVGDLEVLADTLGVETMSVVGLSGGGPYALALGHGLPDRVQGVGVLGGVAPTVGPEAAEGGIIRLAVRLAPVLSALRVPLGVTLTQLIRLARPVAGPGLDLYAAFQPVGDRTLLGRPEFKAMFLDDLLNGSRFQASAPLNDLILFARDWGFSVADIDVPVRWWHGDADHIVPLAHGQHTTGLLQDVEFRPIEGESHLCGLGIAEEVLGTMAGLGVRRPAGRRLT